MIKTRSHYEHMNLTFSEIIRCVQSIKSYTYMDKLHKRQAGIPDNDYEVENRILTPDPQDDLEFSKEWINKAVATSNQ